MPRVGHVGLRLPAIAPLPECTCRAPRHAGWHCIARKHPCHRPPPHQQPFLCAIRRAPQEIDMAADLRRWALGAATVLALSGIAACQRNEAPTPGVAGGTADAPAAAASASTAVPAAADAQVGRGKDPGQSGEVAPGTTGSAGAASAPTTAPDPNRLGPPAIPPASAPGTEVPVPPAAAPASR